VSEKIELLQQADVSIACLANNHIFDFGEKGITDTLNTCQENGIDTLGVVNRPDGRNHWLIKEIKGKRFGF
jgi:poly-gamma-glutamate capsule biosynthesis protein CapA/YwtB (metallophosphatase superfamily)